MPLMPRSRCSETKFTLHRNPYTKLLTLPGFGFGGYYPYDYYDDYGYNDTYYDNGSCYVVQRRVHTTHGWRRQPVQVCG